MVKVTASFTQQTFRWTTSINQVVQQNTLVTDSWPAPRPLTLLTVLCSRWHVPKASTCTWCSIIAIVVPSTCVQLLSWNLLASLSWVCSATLKQNPKTVSSSLPLGSHFVKCGLIHQSHLGAFELQFNFLIKYSLFIYCCHKCVVEQEEVLMELPAHSLMRFVLWTESVTSAFCFMVA